MNVALWKENYQSPCYVTSTYVLINGRRHWRQLISNLIIRVHITQPQTHRVEMGWYINASIYHNTWEVNTCIDIDFSILAHFVFNIIGIHCCALHNFWCQFTTKVNYLEQHILPVLWRYCNASMYRDIFCGNALILYHPISNTQTCVHKVR